MNDKSSSQTRPFDDAFPTDERATVLVAAFPVERVAHVTASIHVEPHLNADILAANGVTKPEWEWLAARTRDAIAEEARVGDRARLTAFDRAYLAHLAEERGDVTIEEYALLVVAQERGTRRKVHLDLSIPELATLPISRSWQQRASTDRAVARDLRAAIENARGAKPR